MKKVLMAAIAMALCGIAYAGLDTTGLNYVTLGHPKEATGLATVLAPTGGVSIAALKGNATVVFTVGTETTGNTGSNCAVYVQSASAAGGSFANVLTQSVATTGSGTGVISTLAVNTESLGPVVRISVRMQGTSDPSRVISAVLVAP